MKNNDMHPDTFHLGVKALIKNKEDKILLLRADIKRLKQHPSWNGQVYWDLPGGRVTQGEQVDEALQREVAEETGINNITVGPQLYTAIANFRIPVDNKDVGLLLSVYHCSINTSVEVVLSDEHDSYGWFTVMEAASLLSYKYPKSFITHIFDR